MPAVIAVTVFPLTAHTLGVVLLKLTARPEVAVAKTVPVPPKATWGAVPKVMVWLVAALATLMLCVAWGAAL